MSAVTVDTKDHVRRPTHEDCIGVAGTAVQKAVRCFQSSFGSADGLRSDVVEGMWHGGVNSACVAEKLSRNFLYECDFRGCERFCIVDVRALQTLAVDGTDHS